MTKPVDTPMHVKVSEYPYNSVRDGVGYSTDTGPHIQGSYSLSRHVRQGVAVHDLRAASTRRSNTARSSSRCRRARARWINSVLASYTNTDVSDTRIYSVARRRAAFALVAEHRLQRIRSCSTRTGSTQNAAAPTTSRALVPSWQWMRRNIDDPLFPRTRQPDSRRGGLRGQGRADRPDLRSRLRERGCNTCRSASATSFVFRAEFGGVFTSGPSSGIPASLLFRAGGSNSVRGYSYQSIGNNVDGSMLPTKYLVTGSTEYQHWFTHDWGGAAFFDIGTATDTWSEHVFYPGVGVGRALAQSGRAGERRYRLWLQEQEHAAVSDARHRLLMNLLNMIRHA